MMDFLLQNQIILGMLGAACLFVPWDQRRSFFFLRILTGLALLFVILELTSSFTLGKMAPTLLLYTSLLFLLIWFCFDCPVVQVLFAVTCAYCVQHISSKLTYMVSMPLFLRFSMEGTQTILLLLLISILVAIPVFLIFTVRFLREGQLQFNHIKTVVYGILFLVVAVFLSSILEDNLDRTADTFMSSYQALNAFCVLFAVAILSMEFSNCHIKRLENQKKILEELLKSDKQHYEQAKKDMEKISIRYHDLKYQYSHASAEEKTRLEAEMNNVKFRYFTGNKALDIVLTQKADLCEKAGIRFVCSVDGNCLSGIAHYHIYSMLGNAIDNAFECLSKVEDQEKRVISLTINRRGDMAVICMENYTPILPVLREGSLLTTKQDPSGHGYGTKSIRNIAGLYGGTAEFFVEENIFYLLVTIPCGMAQSELISEVG